MWMHICMHVSEFRYLHSSSFSHPTHTTHGDNLLLQSLFRSSCFYTNSNPGPGTLFPGRKVSFLNSELRGFMWSFSLLFPSETLSLELMGSSGERPTAQYSGKFSWSYFTLTLTCSHPGPFSTRIHTWAFLLSHLSQNKAFTATAWATAFSHNWPLIISLSTAPETLQNIGKLMYMKDLTPKYLKFIFYTYDLTSSWISSSYYK